MRQRTEDLGRIAVMSDSLLDRDFWYLYQGRKKDFCEYLDALDSEKKNHLLDKLIYGIEQIQEDLHKIREIAYGLDEFNNIDSEIYR